MPSYRKTNYGSYDRSVEMLGRSMMLATISEECLDEESNGFCYNGESSSFQFLGLKRSSALSKSYKTGLAELAQAQQQQGSVQQQHHSAQENDDCWGFFMDDE